jgi:hypothetical protein
MQILSHLCGANPRESPNVCPRRVDGPFFLVRNWLQNAIQFVADDFQKLSMILSALR